MDAPALRRHHKVLAWAAMIALVLLSMVGITPLVFGAIMLMGLVGGVYILFRMEDYILRNLSRVRERLPWLWAGGGWRVFVLLTVVFFLLVAIVTTVAVTVGSNEVPGTHDGEVPADLDRSDPLHRPGHTGVRSWGCSSSSSSGGRG